MVSALCRLNECGRWALSQARFMKGLGKREGGRGLVFVFSLFQPAAGQSCCHLVCSPSGFTHSEAGRVSSAKRESGWRSRGTHFAPPVGNPSVFGRAQETRSCCVGPHARRRQQAVVLGTADMRTVGQSVEPPLQQTIPVWPPQTPGVLFSIGLRLHMFTQRTELPFSKSNEDSLSFLRLHGHGSNARLIV
jgi:hypothetical protein